MTWKLPRYLTADGRVVNAEDVNENLLEVVEELGGRLNEHNFSSNVIASTAEMSGDAAFVWHSADAGYVNHFSVIASGEVTNDTIGTTQEIPAGVDWTAILVDGNESISIVTPACSLWILASWQVCAAADASPRHTGNPGARYALKVDGQVISETIIGGVEDNNDKSYDIRYGAVPLATSVVLPVASGEHTISLVCRTSSRNSAKTKIECRELIVLEMLR